MITVPTPSKSKWYGITKLDTIATDPEITSLPPESPVLAVAQRIFVGPGTYRLPNYRFILLTECLVVVGDPDFAVKNSIERTPGYKHTLAKGEISVGGATGTQGDMGQFGRNGRPGRPGGPGTRGGPGGNAGSVYLFAQTIVSNRFALRADGGAGGAGGPGGIGGNWDLPLDPPSRGGSGGQGGPGGRGGNGGQALLIYNSFNQGGAEPTGSARAGAPGSGGQGGRGGLSPLIFGPDGKPQEHVGPPGPTGLHGVSGVEGTRGQLDNEQLEQVAFWQLVCASFSSETRLRVRNFFFNNIRQMGTPIGLWDDYIAAETKILQFFDNVAAESFPKPSC